MMHKWISVESYINSLIFLDDIIYIRFSVGLGQDQSRLVKNLNRSQRGQKVDHGSILA